MSKGNRPAASPTPASSAPTIVLTEAPNPAEALLAAVTLLVRAAVSRPTEASSSNASPEPWLTTAEGARHASVSEETLREWITLGLLPAGRCGRVLRVRRSDIDALLLERGRTSRGVDDDAGEPTGRANEILSDLGRKPPPRSGR